MVYALSLTAKAWADGTVRGPSHVQGRQASPRLPASQPLPLASRTLLAAGARLALACWAARQIAGRVRPRCRRAAARYAVCVCGHGCAPSQLDNYLSAGGQWPRSREPRRARRARVSMQRRAAGCARCGTRRSLSRGRWQRGRAWRFTPLFRGPRPRNFFLLCCMHVPMFPWCLCVYPHHTCHSRMLCSV